MLLATMISLSGMPPFGIFVGELLLVLAGVAAHSWIALGAGLVGISCAFAALSRSAMQIESGRFDPAKTTGGTIPSRLALAATTVAFIGALGIAIVPWTGLGEAFRLTALRIGGGQ